MGVTHPHQWKVPLWVRSTKQKTSLRMFLILVSAEGLEPSTNGLKGRCSTIELRAQERLNSITTPGQRQ